MNPPLFSLVVPMYQARKYLERLIDSIRRQSFADFEVLLADDGSTDGTVDFCRTLTAEDAGFRRVPSPGNVHSGGAGAPRNRGLRAASGDYVLFADADDELETDGLKLLAARLRDTSFPDLLFGECRTGILDVAGNFIASGTKKLPLALDGPIAGAALLEQLGRRNLSCPCNSFLGIFRRTFLLEKELFQRENLLLAEDYEWMPRVLFAAASISVVDFAHYRYIRRSDSITSALSERSLTDAGRSAVLLRDFFLAHRGQMTSGVRRFWCKYALELFLWFFFNPMYHDRVSPRVWRRAWRNTGLFGSFSQWRANGVLFRETSCYKRGFLPFLLLASWGWRTPGELYFRLGQP